MVVSVVGLSGVSPDESESLDPDEHATTTSKDVAVINVALLANKGVVAFHQSCS
jgi:hypothetical protein